MIRYFIFNFILFINIGPLSFGQEDYPPCAAFDSIGKDSIIAINSFSNSLYRGIDNQILLSEKKIPFKNIIVECVPGMVMEDLPYYLVYPAKIGIANIFVYQFDSIDTLQVLKKAFKVFPVPPPEVTIRHMPLSKIKEISKRDLIKAGKFEVHLSDDFIDDNEWFSIKETTIGYHVGELYKTISFSGPIFSKEMIQTLSNLIPENEVSFAFILIGQSDVYKRIDPIKIKVY